MNSIGINIRRIREEKGWSQEAIAHELGISQSTYGKIEREDSNISVSRLMKIAEILEEEVTRFLDISTKNTFHQNNYNHGNGYIENLNIESKEVYEMLIETQKQEIEFLRSLLDKKS